MDLNPTLAQLSTVLRAAGAVSATAEYAGYGDSGDHFEIAIQWPADPAGNADATEPRSTTSDSLDYPDFDNQFENLVWDAVSSAGHDGWENNEGGGGTFTLLPDGTATLEHYDNVENSNESTHEFGTDSELTAALIAVGTALRSVGAISVTVEYNGYGDSGGVETITLQWPGSPGTPPASIAIPRLDYGSAASSTTDGESTPDLQEHSFDDAVENLLYDAIDLAGHGGWENNDGGGGTFIVHADATASLEHCDNFTDTVNNSYIFGSDSHDASEGGEP
ncbi:DUF6878 family protein [Burkholderia multivorans]|uniref:DUF6878 family protein n=1 Tax=Burkholderia multivorans TaxID=87883 RepID=UPI0021C11C1F|nr:DUF6878 family protein [Burkholderia multivorans]MDR8763318.1 hypothetical protein [Burkholderia multivorans]MDR8768997.1 hypothetical protein [Burkholderia multivorans]MDR8774911.1 hypothetical protein [Burkholderia multivorans]MDR8792523.1 hypothetical protein [Burkholderia multivorans]MDR8798618.1 hypothetical protein [Burkholderia multivorans]